jgi:hypothetical protein
LLCNSIVLVVSSIIPVIDERVEHSTAFPPIIRIWKIARDVA